MTLKRGQSEIGSSRLRLRPFRNSIRQTTSELRPWAGTSARVRAVVAAAILQAEVERPAGADWELTAEVEGAAATNTPAANPGRPESDCPWRTCIACTPCRSAAARIRGRLRRCWRPLRSRRADRRQRLRPHRSPGCQRRRRSQPRPRPRSPSRSPRRRRCSPSKPGSPWSRSAAPPTDGKPRHRPESVRSSSHCQAAPSRSAQRGWSRMPSEGRRQRSEGQLHSLSLRPCRNLHPSLGACLDVRVIPLGARTVVPVSRRR
jgi:hypothetical protein